MLGGLVFFSVTSFLAALPPFTWCLSPSFYPLKGRNDRQTKSFPRQQHRRDDPTDSRYLISAVYKWHRNILSFYAACLTCAVSPCDPDFLKLVIFAFQKREMPYQKRANAVTWPFQPLDSQCIWVGQTGLGKKRINSRWIYEKSLVADGAYRHLLTCPRLNGCGFPLLAALIAHS